MARDRFIAVHDEMDKYCSDAQLQESLIFIQAEMARRMNKREAVEEGGGEVAQPTPARAEPLPDK